MDGFDFDFQYHWMTVTIYPGSDCIHDVLTLIKSTIEHTFRGSCLEHTGHGGNAYTDLEIWQGIRLYYGGEQNGGTYSLSISGEHIGSLNLGQLRDFLSVFRDNHLNLKFTRLDLAFDACPDKVCIEQVHEATEKELFRCRATREKICFFKQVFGSDETIAFGSRASTRYMRIYNRRGFVRFELELKKEAAELIGENMLDPDVLSAYHQTLAWAVGVMKDFIDFDADFWQIFSAFDRAGYKVSCFEAQTMARSKENIEKRIATTLTALVQIEGIEWLNEVLYAGSMGSHEKGVLWGYEIPYTAPVVNLELQRI